MPGAMSPGEIGLRDIFEGQQQQGAQLTTIVTQLATIMVRLDSGQAKINDHEERLRVMHDAPKADPAQVADHEKRLRAVERWKQALPLATLLALASSVAAVAALLRH